MKGKHDVKKTVTCKKCGSVLEYDDKSIWEGNRENEELECPVCKNVIGYVFTDLIPTIRVISNAKITPDKKL